MKYWIQSDLASDDTVKLPEALKNLVEQVFSTAGLSASEEDIDEADVVVHWHPYSGVERTVEEVAVCPYPSSVRLVVLLRSSPKIGGEMPKALSRCGNLEAIELSFCEDNAISELLGKIEKLKKQKSRTSDDQTGASQKGRLGNGLDLKDLFRLLETAIGGSWSKSSVSKWVKELCKPKKLPEKFGDVAVLERVVDGNAHPELFEFLQILTKNMDIQHHNERTQLDYPFEEDKESDGESVGSVWRLRRFQEVLADIYHALLARGSLLARLGCDAGRSEQCCIWVFDDKPEDPQMQDEFKAVQDILLGGKLSFEIRDPLKGFRTIKESDQKQEKRVEEQKKNDEELFSYFINYNTLKAIQPSAKVASSLDNLRELISAQKPKVFLVDQMLKTEGGHDDAFLGAKLIRGLKRWMEDDPELKGQDLPELMALSRSDDPGVIRQALRNGAKDYVLKSRFLAFPAVLERIIRGTGDHQNNLHRNFRSFYDLPNETIGLLHDAKIPRVPFHFETLPDCDPGERNNDREKTVPSERLGLLQDWADLLRSLPKTDLHVHAGSVMSPEFLTYASLVMLARHSVERLLTCLPPFVKLFHALVGLKTNEIHIAVPQFLGKSKSGEKEERWIPLSDLGDVHGDSFTGSCWFSGWANALKKLIQQRLEEIKISGDSSARRSLRASMHEGLKIQDFLEDHKAVSKLNEKDELSLALFLLRLTKAVRFGDKEIQLDVSASEGTRACSWGLDDLIRIYLLTLASRYQVGDSGKGSAVVTIHEKVNEKGDSEESIQFETFDFFQGVFANDSTGQDNDATEAWKQLRKCFWTTRNDRSKSTEETKIEVPYLAVDSFQSIGWRLPEHDLNDVVRVLLVNLGQSPDIGENFEAVRFDQDPIGYTLATGTRSSNLVEYLQGCEFSGAEHLRHPFLMHLYARQTVLQWVNKGVFYSELRASPDGYVNPSIDFEYPFAVRCLIHAFKEAQAKILELYQPDGRKDKSWLADVLGERFKLDILDARKGNFLPVKTSLIFVGKRHKSLREMILEAAGAAVLRPAGDKAPNNGVGFIEDQFKDCRVVGFDLAGPESGNPPSKHAAEFGRLNRLHLPITVHAGENEKASFIEDSILELGAKRIGHGLSLAEDRRLMARVRDDAITIELNPVCNHQTSQFHSPKEDDVCARHYPLKKFLQKGILVCINTDNPIVSRTDIVREYFQASYAYDSEGLSLWDALRIIRMGFISTFLNMAEKRQMINIVEQCLHDLFSEDTTRERLRRLCEQSKGDDT